MRSVRLFLAAAICVAGWRGYSQVGRFAALPERFQRVELEVAGVAREALIYAPANAKATNTPLVFVFHGHGGNARQAARSFAMNQHWPEAISIYPQGLNTPGQLTDPEGKRPGWQARAGDQGDRDLKFFDALFARVKQDYRVATNRIFATGHSNGGGFTYLLWSERGEVLAAVAPSAAASFGRPAGKLKPKPALHLAGKNDPLVKFAWQEWTMDTVRRVNGCAATGQPWADQAMIYPSTNGAPLVTFIHPGGHELHRDGPALIARFFRETVP